MGNLVSPPGQSLIGWLKLPTEVAKPLRGRAVSGAPAGLVLGLSVKMASPACADTKRVSSGGDSAGCYLS